MFKNLIVSAATAVALAFAGVVFLDVDNANLRIMIAAITVSIGWNIFNTLESERTNKREKTARDIDNLLIEPLRKALNHLAVSKDDFDVILATAAEKELAEKLDAANAEIFQKFVSLANLCKRIESYKRPEFGSGWSKLTADAEDAVSKGFETLLEAGGGPSFNEGAALVRNGLDRLHAAIEQKIHELPDGTG